MKQRTRKYFTLFSETRPISFWLFLLNIALLAMVLLGGVTRLTGSGLSIVEWQPFSGILPPFSTKTWEALFHQYQLSPEFKCVNWFFTLSDFKTIFWLEYFHRLLGRLLGLFLLIPTVSLWRDRSATRKLLWLWFLGGSQGVFGWWMVKSGLVHNPWVSPFRLTGHLLLALLIFSISWTLFLDQIFSQSLRGARRVKHQASEKINSIDSKSLKRGLMISGILLVLTITWGGLVAGTKAGLLYNTFPLMDGQFLPDSFWFLEPWWLNFLENPGAIQWTHRMLALGTMSSFFYVAWICRMFWILGAAALCQGALGAWTVLGKVPLVPAVSHQLMAFVLTGLWLWVGRKYAYMATQSEAV